MVEGRVRAGRLRALHRGVYQVGPIAGTYAAEMAALLACGDLAAVSHGSAALVWGVESACRRPENLVEITVPVGRRPRAPGVRIHRGVIRTGEVSRLHGLTLTTPARTLLDIAPLAAMHDLGRALTHFLERRLVDQREIEELLRGYPSRPGTPKLRALLESPAFSLTLSDPEDQFRALIRAARIPDPESNVKVCGYRVDFFWRDACLVVEVDGFAFHSSKRMFEKDRSRDAVLTAAGIGVIRVTWRQLQEERLAIVARIAQAYALGRTR
jgi:very-short-patch-repair endonuclease